MKKIILALCLSLTTLKAKEVVCIPDALNIAFDDLSNFVIFLILKKYLMWEEGERVKFYT